MSSSDSGDSPGKASGAPDAPLTKEAERECACAIQTAIRGLTERFSPRLAASIRDANPSVGDISGLSANASAGLRDAIIDQAKTSPKIINGFAHRVTARISPLLTVCDGTTLEAAVVQHFTLDGGEANALIAEIATIIELADRLSVPFKDAVTRVVEKCVVKRTLDDDLRQEAWIALRRAALEFDPSESARFLTYAVKVVSNHLSDIRCKEKSITVYAERLMATFELEKQSLLGQMGRQPTEIEVVSALGWSPKTIETYRKAIFAAVPTSIHASELMGTLIHSKLGDFLSDLSQKQSLEQIPSALETLPPDERRVIVQHFFGGLSLRQLARDSGVPEQRIRRLCDAGLSSLQRRLESAEDGLPKSGGIGSNEGSNLS